jgi:hypothetical protein
VLATGSYPDMGEPRKDEHGTWHLDSLVLPNALFSSRVAGPLRALILRMLSIRPEQRGTPAELAQALEQAADSLSPPRLLPSVSEAEPATVRGAEAPDRGPREPVHARPLWLTLAIVAGAIATWAGWMARAAFFPTPEAPPRASQAAHPAAREGSPEEEPVGLGEAAASTAPPGPALPSASEPLAQDTPPEPFEGQAQPDKKGRCPRPQHVIFNGSCWGPLELNREKCEDVSGQMYQGTCYVPIFPRGVKRPNTSGPGTSR